MLRGLITRILISITRLFVGFRLNDPDCIFIIQDERVKFVKKKQFLNKLLKMGIS